jgi:hypothetical protein
MTTTIRCPIRPTPTHRSDQPTPPASPPPPNRYPTPPPELPPGPQRWRSDHKHAALSLKPGADQRSGEPIPGRTCAVHQQTSETQQAWCPPADRKPPADSACWSLPNHPRRNRAISPFLAVRAKARHRMPAAPAHGGHERPVGPTQVPNTSHCPAGSPTRSDGLGAEQLLTGGHPFGTGRGVSIPKAPPRQLRGLAAPIRTTPAPIGRSKSPKAATSSGNSSKADQWGWAGAVFALTVQAPRFPAQPRTTTIRPSRIATSGPSPLECSTAAVGTQRSTESGETASARYSSTRSGQWPPHS